MIVDRRLEPKLRQAAGRSPVLTITGPRQSGKTTIVKKIFKSHAYVNLEIPNHRQYAINDPLEFLSQFQDGLIIDEVQYAPELLSYIQSIVDENPQRGRFILTGSQNLALLEQVSQSLAGRTSLHQLHPLSWDELRQFPNHAKNLEQALYTGGYPRIFNEAQNPSKWLGDYVQTYLERDVRKVRNIDNYEAFHRFIQLCAGHSGSLLKYSNLASNCGISEPTVKKWIGVLEAGFILFRVFAFHGNPRKRIVKMPKLYFFDTGLMCYLLGIHEPDQIRSHPIRGQIFETWVAAELTKIQLNSELPHELHFYRDHNGIEADLVIPQTQNILLVEAKSTSTPSPSLLRRAKRVKKHFHGLPQSIDTFVVYGGEQFQRHKEGTLVPWRDLNSMWNPSGQTKTAGKTVEI